MTKRPNRHADFHASVIKSTVNDCGNVNAGFTKLGAWDLSLGALPRTARPPLAYCFYGAREIYAQARLAVEQTS